MALALSSLVFSSSLVTENKDVKLTSELASGQRDNFVQKAARKAEEQLLFLTLNISLIISLH